jgi:cell division protein FtsL
MKTKTTIFGMTLSQAIALFSFLITIISIWINMEIRIAEINVEITTLKEELQSHKTENRKDFETVQSNSSADSREILRKIDEIQIYLRNKKK